MIHSGPMYTAQRDLQGNRMETSRDEMLLASAPPSWRGGGRSPHLSPSRTEWSRLSLKLFARDRVKTSQGLVVRFVPTTHRPRSRTAIKRVFQAAAGGPDGGFRRPPNSSPKKKRPRRLLPVLGRPRRSVRLRNLAAPQRQSIAAPRASIRIPIEVDGVFPRFQPLFHPSLVRCLFDDYPTSAEIRNEDRRPSLLFSAVLGSFFLDS